MNSNSTFKNPLVEKLKLHWLYIDKVLLGILLFFICLVLTFATHANPADTDPPTIVSMSPGNYATSVDPNIGSLTLTLSEPIFANGDLLDTYDHLNLRYLSGGVIQSFEIDESDITISGSTITLNNVAPLSYGQTYYIQNYTGAQGLVKDAAGNKLADFNNSTTWRFTTRSSDLYIVSTSPSDDAGFIDPRPNEDFSITFNQPVFKGTLTWWVQIRDGSNTDIQGFSTGVPSHMEISGNTITFKRGSTTLPYGEDLHIYIPSQAFKDGNNRNFEGIAYGDHETWNFTTKTEVDAPVVSSLVPANNEEGVDPNLNQVSIRFNESASVEANDYIRLYQITKSGQTLIDQTDPRDAILNKGLYTIPFDGHGGLVSGAQYYVSIGNNIFHDNQENYFAGTNADSWTFQVNRAPTNISLSSSSVEEEQAAGAMVGTISGVDSDDGDDLSFALVSGTGSTDNTSFTLVGNQLQTTTVFDYETATSKSIRLRVTDNVGATYERAFTIQIIDVDDTPPIITAISPVDGATGVERSPVITFTFDEDVQLTDATTSTFYLRRVSNGSSVMSWQVPQGGSNENLSIVDNQMIFNVVAILEYNTEYYFDGPAIADLNDNEGNPFLGNSFTTRAAYTGKDILTFSADGQIGNATIDTPSRTITATMDASASFNVETTATYSQGASSSLTNNSPHYFESGVGKVFLVVPESGSVGSWTITLTWQPMSGTYTIGDAGDFASVQTAFNQLQALGISGDVVFEVLDGHTDVLTAYIVNPDPTYNVTIRPEAGATSVDFIPTEHSNIWWATVDVDNIIIDGADPSSGNRVFHFHNQNTNFNNITAISLTRSDDITIKNCKFTISRGYGIRTSTLSGGSSNLLIDNCEFEVDALDNSQNTYGISVEWNGATGVLVSNNSMYKKTGSPDPQLFNGIVAFNSLSAFNNSISMAASFFTGISLSSKENNEVVYNTVHLYGDNTGLYEASQVKGLALINNSGTLKVQNNLINIERSYTAATTKAAVTFYSGYSNQTISHNNLSVTDDGVSTWEYVTNGSFGHYQLESEVLNYMPNTTFSTPQFTNAGTGDLSLAGASREDDDLRGIPVDGISTDILGTNRSAFIPSKGAYEVANTKTDFVTFSIPEQYYEPVINKVNHTVLVEVTPGTPFTALVPTFTLSPGATVNPASGDEQDFTDPVNYFVSSENEAAGQNWMVTVAEADTPPMATSYSPSQGETGVLVNDNVSIAFNEPTLLGTGFISLHDGTSIVETVDVTSMQANHSSATFNSTLSVTFSNLLPETNYAILVDEGVVEDPAGNKYEGIDDLAVWTFTTMDDESDPPVWYYEYPESGSIDVSVTDIESDGIFFEFNENILLGTGNIEIRNSATDELIKSIDINDENNELGEEGVDLYGVGFLPTATQMYVLVCNTCITDILGNPYAGNSPGDWTFTTAGPRITGLSPADGAIEVNPTDDLVVTFNENVQYSGESGYVRIFKNDDSIVETINLNIAKATFADNTLTINPDTELDGSASYYVQITDSGINGVSSGIDFGGISDQDSWTFTTLDNISPTLVSFDPTIDQVKVANNSALVLTLSEDMQLTNYPNDEIRIRNLSNPGTIYKTIDPSSGDVTIDGNVITITPSSGILSTQQEVEVYVGWSTTPFEDLAGNDLNELFDTSYKFTVDNAPPSIQSIAPENDASDIAVNLSQLSLVLSETVNSGVAGKFELLNAADEVIKEFVMGTSDVVVSGNTITLNNVPLLSNLSTYWVRNNNTGANAIQDVASNPLGNWTDDTTWEFTTAEAPDEESPILSGFSTSGAVALDANLEINYNEPVQINSGSYFLRDGSGQLVQALAVDGPNVSISGNTVVLNPSNNLIYHTDYTIEAASGVVIDLSGNPAPAIGSGDWSFSAEGIISALSPADEANDVSPFDDLEITFSKGVELQSGGIFRIFRKSDDQQLGVNWSFNGATIDGNTVSYDIPMDLDPGVEVYININGGIEDDEGNPVDITDNETWNFTPVKQNQTVTLNPIDSKTYGDQPFLFEVATATSGLGIDYTSSDPTVATVSANQITIVGAGTTTITATQAGNTYYNSASATQDFTVDKASQTISFAGPASKTYGDDSFTLSATVSPSGDEVQFAIESGTAVSLNEDQVVIIGTGEVTIRAFVAESDNYLAPTSVDRDFTVAKKTLTATADNQSKTYGEDNPALTISYDGFVYDETIAVIETLPTTSTTAAALSGVGIYEIDVLGGSDDNYTIALIEGELEITRKTLIASADDKSREYGDENPAFSLSFDGFIDGENSSDLTGPLPTRSTLADEESTVGEYTISVSGGSDDNYEYQYEDGILTITKAELTVYAVSTIKNYGDDNPTLSIEYEGFKNEESDADLDIIPQVSTDVTKYSPAGNHPIEVSGGASNNYSFDYINGVLAIGKIDLSAIVDDQSRAYGEANPEFTISYSGFIAGEDENNLDVLPQAVSSADEDSDVGSYAITIEELEDTNYEISVTAGTLTIEKADQNISLTDITDKVKNADPFTVEASVDSESELSYNILSGPATILGNTITLTGGLGTVTVEVSALASTNYNAAAEQVTFEVNDKQLQTISFSLSDQVYGNESVLNGSASSSLEVSYEIVSGPLALENGTLTFTGVGLAEVKALQAGDDTYNEAEPVTVEFTVDKAVLTVSADDKSITYGSELPELTYNYSGFVYEESADDLTSEPTVSTEATDTSDAGVYTLTIEGGSADNYSFDLVDGELTIMKADPVLTLETIDNKSFDAEPFTVAADIDSDQSLAYTITGPASISETGLITLDGDAGEVEVTVSAASNTNYNAASESVSFFVLAEEMQDQTITLGTIENKLTTDSSFEVEVSASSGLEVEITVTGPATVSGQTITLDGSTGIVTVFANQSGNEAFNAAEEVSTSFEVTEPEVLAVGPTQVEIRLFPNPATDWLNVAGFEGMARLQLINTNGRVVVDQMMRAADPVNITHVRPGLYLVQTIQEDITTTTKVLIQR
ncbi:MAG: Ig-like domain-containing protein [Reichenbachiella sp.]|uniref:Ig-like domain-containing protein n=1 Tax=Reichenbachiella sp. TaxID=2184521 RepID=UPI003267D914